MPTRIIIQHPEHLASDSGKKFDTYRFYLECIWDFLLDEYRDWNNFVDTCIEKTKRIQGIRNFDENWIERFLKISWNTEFLLRLGPEDVELIRINNQWAPIQAYYAVYSVCEALAYVIDKSTAGSHKKALKKSSNFFIQSGLSPWKFAYTGAVGREKANHKPYNFPDCIELPHNLKRVDVKPINMIAKCLKAEHSHRVDDSWISKKISGAFKYQYNPGYTTLLHFLYRLRIKSNYEEVDLFLSQAPDHNIISFANSLLNFCVWTISYVEIILMRRCGKKLIFEIFEKYLKINKNAEHLRKRKSRYKRILK